MSSKKRNSNMSKTFHQVSQKCTHLKRNYDVHWRAAEALGKIGDSAAVTPLIQAWNDEDYSVHYFKEQNILILGLNSAWELDHHYKSRASINPSALSKALNSIRQNQEYQNCLKFEGNTLTVRSRKRQSENGAWEADNCWRQGRGKPSSDKYTIELCEWVREMTFLDLFD